MNFDALIRNIRRSRAVTRNARDRLKYLWWLYGSSLPFRPQFLKIKVVLDAPIGTLMIKVRCKTGADYFIFSEVFEHGYYDLPLNCVPRTVLDLGANIGLTALYFARMYPTAELACVEPMPENLALLESNLADNRVNATVHGAAISITDAPIKMQRARLAYGSKPAEIPYGARVDGETVEVRGVSILSLMHQLGWSRIDLVKIDIEGYEAILLRENASWLKSVDNLCIEIHEGFSERELRDVAAQWGFKAPRRLAGTWLVSRGPN